MPRMIFLPSSTLTKSWIKILGSASLSAVLQTETEDSIEATSGAVMKAHLAHVMLFYRRN